MGSAKHKLLVRLDINRSSLGEVIAGERDGILGTIDSKQILICAANSLNSDSD